MRIKSIKSIFFFLLKNQVFTLVFVLKFFSSQQKRVEIIIFTKESKEACSERASQAKEESDNVTIISRVSESAKGSI